MVIFKLLTNVRIIILTVDARTDNIKLINKVLIC